VATVIEREKPMSEYRKFRNRNQPVGLNPDTDTQARDTTGASDLERVGGPGPHSVLAPRRRGGAISSGVSAVSLVAGAWLALAAVALNYDTSGPGLDAYWNDIVIGSAIALVAVVRMVTPFRSAALGLINVALGAWLIIAPFVLAYGGAALWNDVVVGVVVVVAALVSSVLSRRRQPAGVNYGEPGSQP
jgi:hypothetical protein